MRHTYLYSCFEYFWAWFSEVVLYGTCLWMKLLASFTAHSSQSHDYFLDDNGTVCRIGKPLSRRHLFGK